MRGTSAVSTGECTNVHKRYATKPTKNSLKIGLNMKSAIKISSNIVDYEFWLWEYQRRNSSYQNNLAEITSKAFAAQAELKQNAFNNNLPTPQSKNVHIIETHESVSTIRLSKYLYTNFVYQSGLKSILSFIAKNKRFPKPPSEGNTGEKLVEDFLISPKPLSFPVQDFHIPSILSQFTKNGKIDKYILKWKCTENFEIIQLELNWHLHLESDILSSEREEHSPSAIGKSSTALDAIRCWWAKRHFNERLTIPPKPRAVGLWLWDYQHTHGLSGAKAINAFQENWVEGEHSKSIPAQFHHDDKLRKLLKITDGCIKKVAVLPIA